MLRPALALLLCALAPPLRAAPAASPLPLLAQRLAEQLLRVAGERPLELAEIENGTAQPSAALDLRSLLRGRLEGRVRLAEEGPRLRVLAVLSHSDARLVASARLVEEPGGRLVDIVSASVEADAALLALPTASGRERAQVELVARTRSTPLDGRVLDLAFVGPERILALFPDALGLYRWDGMTLSAEGRLPLGEPQPVRHPGGLLLAGREGVWALTGAVREALLVDAEGGRLVARSRAQAIPWMGAPAGLRFRAGTDWLEGDLPGLGPGPFLAVEPPDLAVTTEGGLLAAGQDGPTRLGPRVGPALARLWNGWLAAVSAEPPGARDHLLLIDRSGEVADVKRLPLELEGAARALAADARGDTGRLAVAVEPPAGGTYLELLELRRVEAEP